MRPNDVRLLASTHSCWLFTLAVYAQGYRHRGQGHAWHLVLGAYPAVEASLW